MQLKTKVPSRLIGCSDILVSTVSLGNAYKFGSNYPLGKFETMIMYKENFLDYQDRYDYEEDAKIGQQKAILAAMEGDFDEEIKCLK